MLDSDIIYTIMRTFPESIVLIWSGLTLLGIKKDKISILKQGILFGIIVYIIRRLPINFGIHTVLCMITIGIILINISKGRLINSIIVTCQIWIALALSEGLYMVIATKLLNIPFEVLIDNTGLEGAIITLPSLLILCCIVLGFKKIQEKINKCAIRG